jgi:methionine-S-sulfoxide reductase
MMRALVLLLALAACSNGTPKPGAEPAPNPEGASLPRPEKVEVAILAGGCFWGMEEILRKVPGVIDTVVGYAGGDAEAVRIEFDPAKLSYAELLERWYFRMHDPTTLNRQGNDVGTSYRSAIFFTSPEQQRTAEEVRARVDASGKWPDPIVTTIEAPGEFVIAEASHQDYLQENPGGYTCHFLRD